jgi:hypothetical protein
LAAAAPASRSHGRAIGIVDEIAFGFFSHANTHESGGIRVVSFLVCAKRHLAASQKYFGMLRQAGGKALPIRLPGGFGRLGPTLAPGGLGGLGTRCSPIGLGGLGGLIPMRLDHTGETMETTIGGEDATESANSGDHFAIDTRQQPNQLADPLDRIAE